MTTIGFTGTQQGMTEAQKDFEMNEMIERVAKALWLDYWDGDACAWEDAEESARETSRSLARAAIEAMREPTEDMIEAGRSENFGNYPNQAWHAMIDQALTELGPRRPAGSADKYDVPRADE
jgi:hypothetical protein